MDFIWLSIRIAQWKNNTNDRDRNNLIQIIMVPEDNCEYNSYFLFISVLQSWQILQRKTVWLRNETSLVPNGISISSRLHYHSVYEVTFIFLGNISGFEFHLDEVLQVI